MHRFLAGFIKTTILTSLFLLASYTNSEILYSGTASALIDENGHAEIPDLYTIIGTSAFQGRTNLLSVKIPNTITQIGGSAFRETRLRKVVIPDSVTSIGSYAFKGTFLFSC
jgi:hypothetical protein